MKHSDYIIYGLLTVATILGVTTILIQTAEALSVEEVETILEEQKELEVELAELKIFLEDNLIAIDKTIAVRESLRLEIGLLKQDEADTLQIIARETVMAGETVNLRDFRLERINMLDEQSLKTQRVNTINFEINNNVDELDETEVEFVSAENINLQININDLEKQIEQYDLILLGIDQEIIGNGLQIDDYGKIRDRYQREYNRIQIDQQTSWLAVTQLAGAKQLAANFDSSVKLLETREKVLEEKKVDFVNQRQTLILVIETSTQKLIDNEADTANQKKLVGLQLSNTCIKLIKNNLPTNCPTYLDLINLDSSNIYFSGEFVTDEDTGFFHRGPSNYQESWRWYDYDDKVRLILDPPLAMSSRIAMITIENNFGVYFAAGDHTIDSERIRNYHSERFIDSCRNAMISADKWGTILTDTIQMLRTGCHETTVKDARSETLPITNIDITTSPNWQYTQWLNASKDTCKTICKQY